MIKAELWAPSPDSQRADGPQLNVLFSVPAVGGTSMLGEQASKRRVVLPNGLLT